jgi:Rieske Fe-S protein
VSDEGTSRRTVISGLVIGGAALPVLAACGGGSSGGAPVLKPGEVIGKTSEVPVGSGKIMRSEKLVVSQPTDGDFKAFSAICTHQGCLLSGISGEDALCGCHGSKFSLKDGSVVHGPANAPLAPVQVAVKGENITVV